MDMTNASWHLTLRSLTFVHRLSPWLKVILVNLIWKCQNATNLLQFCSKTNKIITFSWVVSFPPTKRYYFYHFYVRRIEKVICWGGILENPSDMLMLKQRCQPNLSGEWHDTSGRSRAVASPSRPQGQAPGKLPIFFPIFPFSSHFPWFSLFLWLIFQNFFPPGGHSSPCPLWLRPCGGHMCTRRLGTSRGNGHFCKIEVPSLMKFSGADRNVTSLQNKFRCNGNGSPPENIVQLVQVRYMKSSLHATLSITLYTPFKSIEGWIWFQGDPDSSMEGGLWFQGDYDSFHTDFD